jgi:hypothetical protein
VTSGAPILIRSVHKGRLEHLECYSPLLGFLDAKVDDARTFLGEIASWHGFTWWLSLPTWGSMWMG